MDFMKLLGSTCSWSKLVIVVLTKVFLLLPGSRDYLLDRTRHVTCWCLVLCELLRVLRFFLRAENGVDSCAADRALTL
jgi:hypothetical protein